MIMNEIFLFIIIKVIYYDINIVIQIILLNLISH